MPPDAKVTRRVREPQVAFNAERVVSRPSRDAGLALMLLAGKCCCRTDMQVAVVGSTPRLGPIEPDDPGGVPVEPVGPWP